MTDAWAKMPCSWQISADFHMDIGLSDQGGAIAALKLYLVLCLKANFKPSEFLPTAGSIQRSITQLCQLSGLSRPMVIRGLRRLEEWGIIVCAGGRPMVYQITDYLTAKYWTKLPKAQLYGTRYTGRVDRIASLLNRKRTTLHALQCYVYIACIRNKFSNEAKATYETITEVLGITRNEASRAISMLVANELIGVRTGRLDDFSTTEYSSNVYWLTGMALRRENIDLGKVLFPVSVAN